MTTGDLDQPHQRRLKRAKARRKWKAKARVLRLAFFAGFVIFRAFRMVQGVLSWLDKSGDR